MSEIVDLGLSFRTLSSNITPQGVTAHYGGPSPWRGFRTDHNRCPSIVRSWHAYHLSKGWSGLAYSAVVCPHGTIYKGRWKGKRTAANGTNPGNQRSYAVCYLAGDNDPVTDAAKHAFHDAAVMLGSSLRWNHAEWKSTSCAGDPIRAWQRAGWPRPHAPLDPPTPNTDGRLIVTPEDERKIQAMLDSQGNRIIEFLTAVIADQANLVKNGVYKWTKAMSDLTVDRVKSGK